MRIERSERAGKTVTVVEGFTREKRLMEDLAAELRRALAVGGTVRERVLYLQGDVRGRVRPLLEAKGFKVRG